MAGTYLTESLIKHMANPSTLLASEPSAEWNNLCNRPLPCKTTVQPEIFSSESQFSSATAKLFQWQGNTNVRLPDLFPPQYKRKRGFGYTRLDEEVEITTISCSAIYSLVQVLNELNRCPHLQELHLIDVTTYEHSSDNTGLLIKSDRY